MSDDREASHEHDVVVAQAVPATSRSGGNGTLIIVGLVVFCLITVIFIAGGLIAAGMYFMIQEQQRRMVGSLSDQLARVDAAQVDSEFRTTPDETIEEKRLATRQAFVVNPALSTQANLNQINALLERTKASAELSVEDHYDLDRYFEACQTAGVPSRWSASPGSLYRVSHLQDRFDQFDVIDIQKGKQPGEWIVSVYAWADDEVCSMLRIWVIRKGASYRIFDWEDVEFDLRASEIDAHIEHQTLAGHYERYEDQIDGVLVELEDASEPEREILRRDAQTFHDVTEELRTPIADILHIKACYAWTYFGDSERGFQALTRVIQAPGKWSTNSYVLRYIGQNLSAIEHADQFNAEVGEFPEVSIDRIHANLALDRAVSTPARLKDDLTLLERFYDRSSRVRAAYELGCLTWHPQRLTQFLETRPNRDESFLRIWDERGWEASHESVIHFDAWLSGRTDLSPELSFARAGILDRLDRQTDAIGVLQPLLSQGTESPEEKAGELESEVRQRISSLLMRQDKFAEAIQVDPDSNWLMNSAMRQLFQADLREVSPMDDTARQEQAQQIWDAHQEHLTDEHQRQFDLGHWYLLQGKLTEAEEQWKQLLARKLAADRTDRERLPELESDLINVMVRLERAPEAFRELGQLDSAWLVTALSTGFYQGLPLAWNEQMLELLREFKGENDAYPDWEAELQVLRGNWDEADELMIRAIQELDPETDSAPLQRLRAFFWFLRNEPLPGYRALGGDKAAFDLMWDQAQEYERFEHLATLLQAQYPTPSTEKSNLEARITRDFLTAHHDSLLEQLAPETVQIGVSNSPYSFAERREWWRKRLLAEVSLGRIDEARERLAACPAPLRNELWELVIQMAENDVRPEVLRAAVAEFGDWFEATEHLGLGTIVDQDQWAKLAQLETPSYPMVDPWYNLTILRKSPVDDATWQAWREILSDRADDGLAVAEIALSPDAPEQPSFVVTINGVRVVVTRGSDTLPWEGEVPVSVEQTLNTHRGWVSIDTYLTVEHAWHADATWRHREIVFDLLGRFGQDEQAVAWLQAQSNRVAATPELRDGWRSLLGLATWARSLNVDLDANKNLYAVKPEEFDRLRTAVDPEGQSLSEATIAERLVGRRVTIQSLGFCSEELPCLVKEVAMDKDGQWTVLVEPQQDSRCNGWVRQGITYRAQLARVRLLTSDE